MEILVDERLPLYTTSFVLAELHGLLLNRLNRYTAAQVLSKMDASRVTTVVRVSTRDERRAREIVFGYTDKDFSLVDATSFAVMERLRIPRAFAYDQNFSQFGWQTIGIESPP
jgi:predicted nucleic acid-binding protein